MCECKEQYVQVSQSIWLEETPWTQGHSMQVELIVWFVLCVPSVYAASVFLHLMQLRSTISLLAYTRTYKWLPRSKYTFYD